MKRFNLIIIITCLSYFSCKAQSPVLPITEKYTPSRVTDSYYKDTNGYLQEFVGTWEDINGNEVFKLVIKKETQRSAEGAFGTHFYEDILYGECRYVNAQGQEIFNTLDRVDDPIDAYDHLFQGNVISSSSSSYGMKVKLFMDDPARPYFDYDLILQKPAAFIGEPYLKVMIKNTTDVFTVEEGQPVNNRLPVGREFKLYKVAD